MKDNRKEAGGRFMDNPEGVKSDKISLFDMHEDMQTVDAISIEDLRLNLEDEKNPTHTKDRSSSEERYPPS